MSEPNEPDQPEPDTSEVDKGQTRRVRKLGDRISEARHLRGLIRDPDLQAVEMERSGRRTLVGLWFFLSLGLVFTTAGVQRFLAGKTTMAEPLWWAAWTVEPMFAGLLIVLLNFEAVILSHGIKPDHEWWSRLKHVLLASTMAMNVIPQIMPLATGRWEAFNLGSAAVHAIIPVIVYGIAEVIPVIQARQRQVILAAYEAADTTTAASPPAPEAPPEPPKPPDPAVGTAPVERPTAEIPKAISKGPKLPPPMAQAVQSAYARAQSEGREFTADDIHAVIKVAPDLADQIAASYTQPTNGHAIA
ncbi:hypothetical protein GCM10009854_29150 [Saccharopolyspora halophila]|uniref:DUF2637 domain-containing protein n=1 Tax=Saccharopolyspora halophila TaxID=405551 RepID=A0ABP5TEI4_9PSEU